VAHDLRALLNLPASAAAFLEEFLAHPRKTVVLAGFLFWSLVTVAFSLATKYWHVVVLRAIEGFGEAFYFPAAMALLPTFRVEQVLNAIKRCHPTIFPGVPTMYVAFNNLPDISRYDFSSLRGVFVGAAPQREVRTTPILPRAPFFKACCTARYGFINLRTKGTIIVTPDFLTATPDS
jgi:acyl-CoA synthetase (AMP-forming)/AMP-acid ligase II